MRPIEEVLTYWDDQAIAPPADFEVGKTYRLVLRGCHIDRLTGRLQEVRARHCQLHGDYIGDEYVFVKRRNSEKRPWGSAYPLPLSAIVSAEEV